MDDILHFSMKVTMGHNQHQKGGAELQDETRIREMNWADVQIYDAANKTFWKKMEPNLKDPTFQKELDELRAGQCKRMNPKTNPILCKRSTPLKRAHSLEAVRKTGALYQAHQPHLTTKVAADASYAAPLVSH